MRLFGKIGRRLLGWFLLVALIPILFMGYQGYFFARRAVEQEVFRHMETVAKSKQLAIEQWLGERRQDMDVLAANPLMKSSDRDSAAVRQLLMSVKAKSPQFAVISVLGYQGHEIIVPDTATFVMAAHEGESHLFIKPRGDLEEGFVYLHPQYGPAINLSRGLVDSAGHAYRIIRATLPLSQTLNPIILDTTGLGHTGQAYLVDEDKVMLTPSRFMNHPKPLSHTMDTEGIRRALAGSSGSGVYGGYQGYGAHGEFEGQKVLGAWAYLPKQHWALIAEMNADEALSPLAALRRNALIVAILTLGAILIVVAFISRSISLPIRQLADASLDVSRGNLDRTVVVNLRDEVGELADRFNKMVGSLRESQRQLVQSERLAAIGELVASVVHEIRNPLSAIKMNLQILASKCSQDPVVTEHFKLARSQTERLESMLSELLDYSKPIALNKQPVRVEEVIRDALAHCENGGSIQTRIADNLPPIHVDRDRLAQVLLNLLLNARQALNGNGQITVSAEPTPDSVRISVQDNGQGISEENLKHIFEPFFTTRKNGTGLGLPNARKIVEAHGGQIHIISRPEEGTEAQIDLPV